MRDYLIIAVILISLPVGLILPFYGLLIYAWISYMYPHMYAWSIAMTFPVAKLSALSAVLGTTIKRDINLGPLFQPEMILMVLLWGMFTVSSAFAFYPAAAWDKWQDVSKLVIMALLAAALLKDKKRLRYFLLMIGFSLGFYGFKGGLFGIAYGGEGMIWGPGTSILGANNAIGLALNMCLPILWFLAQEERGWLKRLLQGTFFLCIPAILFTYSRASALTLPIVLLPILLKSRKRGLIIAVLLVGTILSIPYIPQKWWNRQQSTLTYQDDGSAMSRLDNWRFCWRVALDRPLTGAGFEFHTDETFGKYAPEFLLKYGKSWDTHSIYLGILASHGFPGLALFIGMIAFSLLSCRRMQRQVRNRQDLKWISSYCSIVSVGLLAFLINGIFVNMEYFDLPYHLVAVVASLKVISGAALTETVEETKETSLRPEFAESVV